MDNAEAYWGTDSSGCPVSTAGDGTCNGNGDGIIPYSTSSPYEDFLVWEHLGLSGILPGSYTGIPAPDYLPGINVYEGPFPNSGIALVTNTALASVANNKLYFILGGAGDSELYTAVLTPGDTHNIDQKIDDGLPNSGGFIGEAAVFGAGGLCTNAGSYVLSEEGVECVASFLYQ